MRRAAKCLLGIALLTAVVPVAGGAAPGGVTRVIVGDEVIEAGVHVIDYPIVIPAGSSLTITGGATVFLDWVPTVCTHGTAGVCQPTVLVTGGTLRVHDSTLDSHSWDPTDGWSGYSIVGVNATFDLQRSHFIHQETIGTEFPGVARSIVKDNLFEWATTGVQFIRGAEADITGNTIRDSMYGVAVRDSTSTIVGNHFDHVQRQFGSVPFGRAIDVQATLVGEKQFETMVLVENNVVENGVQGILVLNGFPNEVKNNVIRNNTYGATVGLLAGDNIEHTDGSVWTNNVLIGNELQVQVYVSGAPGEVEPREFDFHNNSILDTVCVDVSAGPTHANVQLTVDANDNWWGSASGPAGGRGAACPVTQGNVIIDSWLTVAP